MNTQLVDKIEKARKEHQELTGVRWSIREAANFLWYIGEITAQEYENVDEAYLSDPA